MLTDDLVHFGRALAHLRKSSSLNQERAAERAGITRTMLSRYETGESKPTVEKLAPILDAYGARFGDLDRAIAWVKGGSTADDNSALQLEGTSADAEGLLYPDLLRAFEKLCDVARDELNRRATRKESK